MENTITFTFHGGLGQATIALDRFFPCDAAKLRKLLKMIDEDPRRNELRAVVVQHCAQRAQRLSVSCADLAGKAAQQYARAKNMQPEIDALTDRIDTLAASIEQHAEQLRALKAQLREQKKAQRMAMSAYRSYQRQYVSAENNAAKLKKHAKVAGHGR